MIEDLKLIGGLLIAAIAMMIVILGGMIAIVYLFGDLIILIGRFLHAPEVHYLVVVTPTP